MNFDTIWMAVFYLFVIWLATWLEKEINASVIKVVKKKRSRIVCKVLIKISVLSFVVSEIAESLSHRVRIEEQMLMLNRIYYLVTIIGVVAITATFIIFGLSTRNNK